MVLYYFLIPWAGSLVSWIAFGTARSIFSGSFSCNFCGTIDFPVACETPFPASWPAGVGWTYIIVIMRKSPRADIVLCLTYGVWQWVFNAFWNLLLNTLWNLWGIWVCGMADTLPGGVLSYTGVLMDGIGTSGGIEAGIAEGAEFRVGRHVDDCDLVLGWKLEFEELLERRIVMWYRSKKGLIGVLYTHTLSPIVVVLTGKCHVLSKRHYNLSRRTESRTARKPGTYLRLTKASQVVRCWGSVAVQAKCFAPRGRLCLGYVMSPRRLGTIRRAQYDGIVRRDCRIRVSRI